MVMLTSVTPVTPVTRVTPVVCCVCANAQRTADYLQKQRIEAASRKTSQEDKVYYGRYLFRCALTMKEDPWKTHQKDKASGPPDTPSTDVDDDTDDSDGDIVDAKPFSSIFSSLPDSSLFPENGQPDELSNVAGGLQFATVPAAASDTKDDQQCLSMNNQQISKKAKLAPVLPTILEENVDTDTEGYEQYRELFARFKDKVLIAFFKGHSFMNNQPIP